MSFFPSLPAVVKMLPGVSQAGEELKYGDRIKLVTQSTYAEAQGQPWGCVGFAEDGHTRFILPPSTEKIQFDEVVFTVESAVDGERATGRPVVYGERVIFSDSRGRVWNSKPAGTASITGVGYLGPRPRGKYASTLLSHAFTDPPVPPPRPLPALRPLAAQTPRRCVCVCVCVCACPSFPR